MIKLAAPPQARDISDLRDSIISCEQNVLGAVMMSPPMFGAVLARLGDGDFFDPVHRDVWTAIREASSLGLTTNPKFIAGRMADRKIGDMTLLQYLARLCASTTLIAHEMDGVLTWLTEMWANHTLITKMDEVRDQALRAEARTRDVTGRLLDEIDVIRAGLDRGRRRDRGLLGDFVDAYMDELRGRLDGSVDNPAIRTGLHDLDEILGGILPETLLVMAGRPGMGKTVGATTIALRAASRGKRVAFFSLEMGHRQMIPRCLSYMLHGSRLSLTYQDIIKADPRYVRREHLEALTDAHQRLKAWPIALDMIASPSVAEITSRCRSAAEGLGGKLDLIVVDYLGLMSAGQRYSGSKVHETAEITAGLKALTNQTGTPIILVCQLSRQVEQRPDKRPQLSDLRDSGSIEQDADVVIFPFRSAYYLDPIKDNDEYVLCQNQVEMIVAKNRHGAPGSVTLFANVACSVFDNLAREY
jgi:replicative DNA helicase